MRRAIALPLALLLLPAYGSTPAAASEILGTSWYPIGPAPLTHAVSYCNDGCDADATGRASAIAVNPFNADDVYLGGANGGVWHSTDGGETWEPISDDEVSLAIGALALDECSPGGCNKIYAGTGENAIRRDTYWGGGLLVLDRLAGDPPFWDLRGANEFAGGSINNVLLDPATSGNTKRLYLTLSSGVTASSSESTVTAPGPPAGPEYGIYRSNDDGVTWARLTVPVPAGSKPTDLESLPGNAAVLFAGFLNRGLYRSIDGGATWCALNPEPGKPPGCPGVSGLPDQGTFDHAEVSIVRPGSQPDATLYAVFGNSPDPIGTQLAPQCMVDSGEGQPTLYRSTDGGDTWTLMNAQAPGSYSRYTHALAAREDDADTVYYGGLDLNESNDGGATFRVVGCPCYHPDIHAIVIPSQDPDRIYMASDGGLYVSFDRGGTFFSHNDGLQLGGFQSIASAPGANSLIGGMQDNGVPRWTGTHVWSRGFQGGDGGSAIFDLGQPPGTWAGYFTYQYEAPTGFGVCGGNGTICARGDGIACDDPRAFYPPLVQDPGGSHRLYYGTDRLYGSDDEGVSWQALSGMLADPGFYFPEIRNTDVITTVAVSTPPAPPTTRVYVGYYGGDIFRADIGAGGGAPAWTPVGGAAHGLPVAVVSRIAIDPADEDVAYVTFSSFSASEHLFKTTDGGSSWNPLGAGMLPSVPFNTISIEPSDPQRLWLGTDAGVYRSPDAGDTWEPFGAGIPNVAVYAFAIDETLDDAVPGNGRIYAATHGRGAFVLTKPFLHADRNCVDGQMMAIWVSGHAFPLNQDCLLQIVRDDGALCAASGDDAEGFPVGTDEAGALQTRRNAGGFGDLAFAFACSHGICLSGVPVGNCNTVANPIHHVRAVCGGLDANARVAPCHDQAADNISARVRARRHQRRSTTNLEAATASSGQFELVAALHSETGADRSLCTIQVPFQPGEPLDQILLRGRDALDTHVSCLASGVDAEVSGSPPGATGAEDDWGSPFELAFGAPGVVAGQLVPAVHVPSAAASDLGFEISGIGLPVAAGAASVRIRFETGPSGADGGAVHVTQTSLAGTCEVDVATSPGESAAQISYDVASALVAPGTGGPSPGCPVNRRPLDARAVGDSVIVTVAEALDVDVDDTGIGFFLGPAGLAGVHPAADAGADSMSTCTSPLGAVVLLDGTGSTDPDSTPGTSDDIVSYEWFEDYGLASQTLIGTGASPGVQLAIGLHVATLRVTDTLGLSDLDTVSIDVSDIGTPDADGDGHGDLCDCAPSSPMAWRIPGAVTGLASGPSPSGPGHVLVSWDSLAAAAGPGTVYDILTGPISSMTATGGFAARSCLGWDLPGTSADLAQPEPAPPLPSGFWYLARAQNECGDGGWGDSGLLPDPRDVLDAVDCSAPAPVLSISKSDSPDPVEPGGVLTYTLSYQNTGNADATGVEISDTVPASTTFLSATGGGNPDPSGVVHWNLGALPPVSSGSVQFVVRVSATVPSGTVITNGAYSIDSAETAPAGGSSVTTTVLPPPIVAIDLDPLTPTVIDSARTISSTTSFLDVGVIVNAAGTVGIGDIARIVFGAINSFNTGGAAVSSITPLSIVDLMPPAASPNNATFGTLAGEFQLGAALVERGVPGSPYLGSAVQFARLRIAFGSRPVGSKVRLFLGDAGPGSFAVRAASGAGISGDATADATPVGGVPGSDQGSGAGVDYVDAVITFGP